MNIKELIYAIEDSVLPFETQVKIMVDGCNYDVGFIYKEDYSNGKLQLVLVTKAINDTTN